MANMNLKKFHTLSPNNQAKSIFKDFLQNCNNEVHITKAPGLRQAVIFENKLYGFAISFSSELKIRQFYDDYQGWFVLNAENTLYRFDGELSELPNRDMKPNRVMSTGQKAYTVRGISDNANKIYSF